MPGAGDEGKENSVVYQGAGKEGAHISLMQVFFLVQPFVAHYAIVLTPVTQRNAITERNWHSGATA